MGGGASDLCVYPIGWFRGCFSRRVHRFAPLKAFKDGDVLMVVRMDGYLPHTTLHTLLPSNEAKREVEQGVRGPLGMTQCAAGCDYHLALAQRGD